MQQVCRIRRLPYHRLDEACARQPQEPGGSETAPLNLSTYRAEWLTRPERQVPRVLVRAPPVRKQSPYWPHERNEEGRGGILVEPCSPDLKGSLRSNWMRRRAQAKARTRGSRA